MPSREYYLNSDFDLILRGRPSLLESPDATFVHEMAWHFLFAGNPGDSLIVHRPLPADFLAYLAEKGMEPPRLVLHPAFSPGSVFTPFGWNGHAETLAAHYADPPEHPALAAVKTANSRAFSLELEQILAAADPAAGSPESYGSLHASPAGLEERLAADPLPGGWVAKGDHGHAGTANLRIPAYPLADGIRSGLVRLFAEHGRVVLEPWHERLLDMSVNFTVAPDGGMADFRGHQLLNSRDGAFLGVKIAPTRLPPEPWAESLRASARAVAGALAAIGYHGPAGVDAYVWRSPQGARLRPIVDINARHSMALPAHGLAARVPGKTLLWMWSKPRKLDLPADYALLEERLGPDAFRPDSGRGILAVSPLAFPAFPARPARPARSVHPTYSAKGGGTGREAGAKSSQAEALLRPGRAGFLLSGRDEGDLTLLQSAFARKLGRAAARP